MLNKRKPAARKGKIVLLNASKRFKKGKPKNYIAEEDIRPLAAMYLKGEPVDGEMAVITYEEAKSKDYKLSPSEWVGQNESSTVIPIPILLGQLSKIDLRSQALSATLTQLLSRLSHESL